MCEGYVRGCVRGSVRVVLGVCVRGVCEGYMCGVCVRGV